MTVYVCPSCSGETGWIVTVSPVTLTVSAMLKLPFDTVMPKGPTDAGSGGSLNRMTIGVATATFCAPFGGVTAETPGAVESTVNVQASTAGSGLPNRS